MKLMKLDSDLLSRAEKMKLVLQYGVGLEGHFHVVQIVIKRAFVLGVYIYNLNLFALGVDIDSATKFGIKVARIPSHVTGNAASCAEMAIYLMLGLLRKQVS